MTGEPLNTGPAVFTASQTSNILDVKEGAMVMLDVPTLTSCDFSVEGSFNGTDFRTVLDTSLAQVGKWTGTTGNFITDGDTMSRFIGIPYLRLRSTVNQSVSVGVRLVRD